MTDTATTAAAIVAALDANFDRWDRGEISYDAFGAANREIHDTASDRGLSGDVRALLLARLDAGRRA